MHISKDKALESLKPEAGLVFKKLFERADIEVEMYKPDGEELQTPHDRDEIYIIAEGSGMFQNGDEHHAFSKGDFIFVPAWVEHRFYDFSEDFCVWVFFFGEIQAQNPI